MINKIKKYRSLLRKNYILEYGTGLFVYAIFATILIVCVSFIPDPKQEDIPEDTSVIASAEIDDESQEVLSPSLSKDDEGNIIDIDHGLDTQEDDIVNIVGEMESDKLDFEYYEEDSYIKTKSNLTSKEIDGLLYGTNLSGLGESIAEIEKEYGINSFFTMSVCTLESGYGTSNLALCKNNIFGIMDYDFTSLDNCVEYFGWLIDRYENKYSIEMTPEKINERYCEQNDWSEKVVELMNQYVDKANALY